MRVRPELCATVLVARSGIGAEKILLIVELSTEVPNDNTLFKENESEFSKYHTKAPPIIRTAPRMRSRRLAFFLRKMCAASGCKYSSAFTLLCGSRLNFGDNVLPQRSSRGLQ